MSTTNARMRREVESLLVPLGGMFLCRPKAINYEADTEYGLTLISDLHIGARNVDYDLIEHELAEAKKNKDRVFINGDVFDMILVGDRKRFRSDSIHPRLASRTDAIDASIEWGAELLGPYADIIDMIGTGNHESCIERFHHSDPIKNLIYELNKHKKNADHIIHYGGFTGFIDLRFRSGQRSGRRSKEGINTHRYVIYYHHGVGGSAPVTGGMIDFARASWAIADVVWFGHKHRKITTSIQTVSCPIIGDDPVVKDVRMIQTGAYFDTYRGQSQASLAKHGRLSNYAADSRCIPTSKGGARLLLSFTSNKKDYPRVRVVQ